MLRRLLLISKMLIPTQVSNEVVQILKDRLPDHSDSFGNILIWYEKRFRKQLLSAAKCSTRDDFLSRLDPVLFRTTYEDGEVFIRLHRSALDINNFHLIPEGFVIPRQDFRAGSSDDVRVVVQEVTSPSQFWVSLWDQFHLLDRLMEDLNRHYDEHKDRTIYQVETAQVGEYYAAKHAGEWHRVKVRRALHQDGKADIFYIDYGTDEEVSISELRLLDLKFSILPAQALRAKLHNLAPAGHPHDGWTSQACFQFLQVSRSMVSRYPIFSLNFCSV